MTIVFSTNKFGTTENILLPALSAILFDNPCKELRTHHSGSISVQALQRVICFQLKVKRKVRLSLSSNSAPRHSSRMMFVVNLVV